MPIVAVPAAACERSQPEILTNITLSRVLRWCNRYRERQRRPHGSQLAFFWSGVQEVDAVAERAASEINDLHSAWVVPRASGMFTTKTISGV